VSCLTNGSKRSILTPHPRYGAGNSVGYISLENFSSKELEFTVWLPSKMGWLYHMVAESTDGKERVVSHNWLKPGEISRYNIKMKAEEGSGFKSGGKYYLYIGEETPNMSFDSPDRVYWHYRYEFILPK